MRLDDAGPRTWLLGAAAGWSVALWLLALIGMGGRIAPLPDDPALAQALPEPAAPVAGRLGPQSGYMEISGRPLLAPDRRPQPFSLEPEGGEGEVVEERFDFVLTGVLLTPGLQMAIVQPAGGGESIRLRVGQSPEGAPSWRLAALSPRGAVFAGPGGEQSLELRSYDGGADLRAAPVPVPMSAEPPRPMSDREAAETAAAAQAAAMAQVAAEQAEAEAAATPEDQVEAIRKRIEARREQLRREARQPPPPQQR